MRKVYEVLSSGVVPDSCDDIWSKLLTPTEDGERVNSQESEILDYKEHFPHSMSDEYCNGIIRLVLAFHNSFGGFIAFGVSDSDRTTGHNKTTVNIERLNQRISDFSSQHVSLKHIALEEFGVDLVFVPKRSSLSSPAFLSKNLGKYAEDTVWFRRDQEVLKVSGENSHFIFSNRSYDAELNTGIDNFKNYFPPSRATIDSFVGRISYLIVLHEWLLKRRDCVMHLYGRGGSGKTKIAYEFAELIRRYPAENMLGGINVADKVLFLTAKESELRSFDATIQDISSGSDFSSRRELIEAILYESSFISSDLDFSKLNEGALEELLFDAFEKETFLIVLDDIDTITTKGEDSGASIVFEAAMQSTKSSKVLVTQRDTPKEWIRNSKKVLGFKDDIEFINFVTKCCEKFNAELPGNSELSLLKKTSDGIPLIVETIVGLAKGYEGWEKTIEQYNNLRGVEARRYLHDREYQSLEDSRSKLLLLALSFFKKAATYDDLKFVLQCTDEQIQSAISEASGMFINRVQGIDGAKFILTETASQFIEEVAEQNTRYERTKARYKLRVSGKYPSPDAAVSKLIVDMKKALAAKNPELVLQQIESDQGPKIEENIHYKEMKAQIFAALTPPRVTEARNLFNDCLECNNLNTYAARAWVQLESDCEHYRKISEEICPYVLSDGKQKEFHSEFYSKRAFATSQIAKDLEYTSADEAFSLFESALNDNIMACNCNTRVNFRDVCLRNTKSSAWSLVNCGLGMNAKGQNMLKDCFQQIGKKHSEFDFSIIAQPFLKYVSELVAGSKEIGPSSAQRGFLTNIKSLYRSGVIHFENNYFDEQLKKLLLEV